MDTPDLTGLSWRKSTRSGNNENCVEVGFVPGVVAVRDSKDKQGPVLAFPAPTFAAFLASAKAGWLG